MTDPTRWTGQMPSTRQQQQQPAGDGTNLADILERVLDKGIVIAGDIQINLLDIELLTIKLRLIVASVDRAKEMGIDWWERDPTLSSGHRELEDENRRLRDRLEALEGGDARPAGVDEIESDEEYDDPEGDLPAEEFAGDEDADDDVEEAEIVDDESEPEEPEPGSDEPDAPEPVEAPRRRSAGGTRARKQRS
jgi:hypothetical protein